MHVCRCLQVKLVQHTYSCLFGTFLCNTPAQRAANQVHDRTLSVWSLFSGHTTKFVNLLYTAGADQVGNEHATAGV